eukprot:TRINITY_DN5591_c0_g1_i3.p1 TRINITY_DN5591_c0_g1~~TRINITY_DN5591_c0_g1_i3.p1  ORF type:complete len:766 (-),score=198.43 TRINITY_DN5591_c0_g1_i3:503-2800(-)
MTSVRDLRFLSVEDLTQGLHEWRNIQEIVRQTFRGFYDVIRSQGEMIENLQLALDQKAGRSEIQLMASQKANVGDMQRKFTDLARLIDQKAELQEIEDLVARKANTTDMLAVLERKADAIDVRNALDLKADLSIIASELRSKANVVDVQAELDKKIDRSEFTVALGYKASAADLQRIADTRISTSEISIITEQNAKLIEMLRMEVSSKVSVREVNDMLSLKANLPDVNRQLDTKANIDDVNEALNLKANKQSVISALQKKANKLDVEEALLLKPNVSELNEVLSRKADVETVSQLVQQRATKREVLEQIEARIKEAQLELAKEIIARPTLEEIEIKLNPTEIHSLLATKASRKDINALAQQIGERLEGQSRSMDEYSKSILQDAKAASLRAVSAMDQEYQTAFAEFRSTLSQKMDGAVVHNEINKLEDRVREDMRTLSSDIQTKILKQEQSALRSRQEIDNSARATARDCCEEISRELQTMLNEKVSSSDCREMIASSITLLRQSVDAISIESGELRRELSGHGRDIQDLFSTKLSITDFHSALAKKADKSTVQSQLAEKADAGQITHLLERKANITDLELVLKKKANADEVFRALELKASIADLGTKADAEEVSLLKDTLRNKPDVKDVCTLVDQKANITDINAALGEVNQELEARALVEDLHKVLRAQAAINQALCADTLFGRWLWKTGKLKPGNLIPWTVQSVNTSPDVFGWEKDKVAIVVSLAGLYEITFGFYSRKKPIIQLLVNGEPIMSSVNSASYPQI